MMTPTREEISATRENHLVFVVLAERLEAWQPPGMPEGKNALRAHLCAAREYRIAGEVGG